jgi:hypothetical protein
MMTLGKSVSLTSIYYNASSGSAVIKLFFENIKFSRNYLFEMSSENLKEITMEKNIYYLKIGRKLKSFLLQASPPLRVVDIQ